MFASAWRGSRWVACALGVAALFAAVLMIAPASGGAGARTAASAKKCTKAIVGGRHACLRKGDKCKKAYQDDYVAAGLSCKKGKLRKASIKERRGPQPLLIDDKGQISLQTALAGFDETVANLPGVKAKKGEIGTLDDATLLIDEIAANLSKLTPAQLEVYTAATTPAADALIIPPEGTATPPAARRAKKLTEREEFELYLDEALAIMRNHGFALLRPIKLSLLTDQGGQKPNVLAYVDFGDIGPNPTPYCNMFVTQFGRTKDADYKRTFITHELAHCAQHAFYTSFADRAKVPAWVVEGGADFLAGLTVEEEARTPVGLHWSAWLDDPESDLFKRTYDGLGFYSMLTQAGIDGWSRYRQILSAATSGGSNGAYAAATAGVPDVFYDRWGPGLLRDTSLGEQWEYEGSAIPESEPDDATVSPGSPDTMTIAAHGSAGESLKINGEILTIKVPKGLRGLLSSGGSNRKLAQGAYCAKQGGCKCRTHTNLQIPQVDKKIYVGFNDPKKGRTVTFEARKLKDYCKHPTPGPGTGPGDGGGGGSCPTTPSGGTAKRDCPSPAPGIQVFDDPESGVPIATFTIGSCTQGAGGFTAIAESGPYTLEVGISNFTGFGNYTVPYGGPDPVVVLEGPFGTMSNETWQPGGLQFSGAIDFNNGDRHALGVGWIEYRTADQSAATTAAGGMTCVYPDDEP